MSKLGEARNVQPHDWIGVTLRWLTRFGRLPCALGLISALTIPNIVWAVRDHTPWPWDQAWYAEVSVDLWFNLTHSMVAWARTMLTGINMKPPGIVWIGQFFVPFGYWWHSIENALLLSVILTQAMTLFIIFEIGRGIAPRSNAVPALGVCMAGVTQSFVGLSHQFFVEPLQALTVAWIVLIAVRCTEWSRPRIVLHLAAALIAGVLAKATTPLYCLLPCLYIGTILLRKPPTQGWEIEWRSASSRAIGAFIAVTTPLAAMWYAINLRAVWQHVRDASSGEIALQYGFRASIGSKLVVWLRLLDQSFLSPDLTWVLILAAVIGPLAIFLSRGKRVPTASIPFVAAVCGIQCGLLLLVFSANDTVDPRYMYAMLPLVLVIVMTLCARIQSWLTFALMFSLCGLQFGAVQGVALGTAGPLANQFTWLLKPYGDGSRFADVERVVGITSTVNGRYNIMGVEEPWFNANTMSFFAAKHRLDTGIRSYFTSLGYAQSDVNAASKRVRDFQPMYYITLDKSFQTIPPNFVNIVSLPMLKRIEVDRHFELLGKPSSNGVLVFRSR